MMDVMPTTLARGQPGFLQVADSWPTLGQRGVTVRLLTFLASVSGGDEKNSIIWQGQDHDGRRAHPVNVRQESSTRFHEF